MWKVFDDDIENYARNEGNDITDDTHPSKTNCRTH